MVSSSSPDPSERRLDLLPVSWTPG